MNYFLDTCLKIAFVFCTDLWNDETYELFDNKHVFYCSYNVEKEFDGKYNDILKEHSSFFYALKDDLNQNFKEYITLSDLKTKSKIIDFERDFDENKKEKISEIIWKYTESKHTFNHTLNEDVCKIKDIIIFINKLSRSFESRSLDRRNEFERNIIQYPEIDNSYDDLNDKLVNKIDIHKPDNLIIIDAHDLSIEENIPLDFITLDNKMILKIKNFLYLLNINNFYYLKEYTIPPT